MATADDRRFGRQRRIDLGYLNSPTTVAAIAGTTEPQDMRATATNPILVAARPSSS
jgi:hypothetical protein